MEYGACFSGVNVATSKETNDISIDNIKYTGGEDKKYARIRTLQIVTDALEKAVEENVVRGIKSPWKKKEKEAKKSK